MDFARVMELVFGFLEKKGYPYALIGGLALAASGRQRATLDLDLVVEARAQQDLVAFLEERGYETLHRSEGYSNLLHQDPKMGRIDFVYVRGNTIERLFSAVRRLRSKKPSESPAAAIDFESAIPTTPSDVRALRSLRGDNRPGQDIWSWLEQASELFPMPPRATTSAGWEPFSLEAERPR